MWVEWGERSKGPLENMTRVENAFVHLEKNCTPETTARREMLKFDSFGLSCN